LRSGSRRGMSQVTEACKLIIARAPDC
jgi:hypothetical protein